MKHAVVLLVCCLGVCGRGNAQAIPERSIESFSGDAAAGFSELANEGGLTLLCTYDLAKGATVTMEDQRRIITRLIERTGLIEVNRSGYDYGTWRGRNATGLLSLSVSCTDLLGLGGRSFNVFFAPPKEQRIPDPILSYLLSKAESHKIDGTDEIDLDFPQARLSPQSKCYSTRTMSIRISTGSLASTAFRVTCSY